jgi:hypothetical protein
MKNSKMLAEAEEAVKITVSPGQMMLSASELERVTRGILFTVVVTWLLVVEHPSAVVAITLTDWPLVRELMINRWLVLFCLEMPSTKNS